MTTIAVMAEPDGPLDVESSAIRRAASAAGLAMPLARRLNWLLRGSRVIAMFQYPSSQVVSMTADEGRIYHRRSVNADRVACIAMIEQGTNSNAQITFKPSGGTTLTHVFPSTLTTTRWGSPSWSMWPFVGDLVNSGFQYHEVTWTNLRVRSLLVLEIPRDRLDSTSDTMVEYMGTGQSGLRSGRIISDGAAGGITDLLAAIASAHTETRRAGGGFLFPSANAWWAMAPWGGTENMFDVNLNTSGGGFKHQALQIREATTDVEYSTVFRARYVHTPDGESLLPSASVSLTSSETAVGVTKAVTDTWAWYVNDGVDVINIAADTEDTLILEGDTSAGDTELQVSSVQWVE